MLLTFDVSFNSVLWHFDVDSWIFFTINIFNLQFLHYFCTFLHLFTVFYNITVFYRLFLDNLLIRWFSITSLRIHLRLLSWFKFQILIVYFTLDFLIITRNFWWLIVIFVDDWFLFFDINTFALMHIVFLIKKYLLMIMIIYLIEYFI